MAEFVALDATLDAQDTVAEHERADASRAEDVQFNEVVGSATMRDYTRALLGDGHLTGAAAELNTELSELGTNPRARRCRDPVAGPRTGRTRAADARRDRHRRA